MAKFIALVRNENLKLRRRKTIWVMLVLLLVFSLGYTAIIGGLTGMFDTLFSDGNMPFEEFCDEQIEGCKGWLANAEDPEDAESARIDLLFYKTLKEIGSDWDDWRYTTGIVHEYAKQATAGSSEAADELKAMIDANDYKAYYRRQIAENERMYAAVSGAADAVNEGLRYCLEHDIEPSSENWKYNTAMRMGGFSFRLVMHRTAGDASSSQYESDLNDYSVAKYRLEHNVRVNPASSCQRNLLNFGGEYADTNSRFWDTARSSVSLVSVVGLFGIIIAAGMVAAEFGKGTVKFLLIAPASRPKILLAKYCSLLLNMAMFLFALFFANLLFAVLFCGGGDLFLPILSVSGGVVRKSSPILRLLGLYLLDGVGTVATATLAFAVSSLLRNSGAAVGVSMLVQFGGNLINTILSMARADWGRYLIFANINLSNIQSGSSYFPHQTVGAAMFVVLLHMAVFLLVAFDAFDRKEV